VDTADQTPPRSGHRQPMQDTEFEQLVRTTQDRALAIARSYLSDWEEARDAVQEAFMRAYRKRGTFRGESRIDTWFFRILANHCRDRLRRRRVRGWLGMGAVDMTAEATDGLEQLPSSAPDPATAAEHQALRRALVEAVEALPNRQREVFRLKALAGLTLAEAADTLGISVGATKSHFFRATRSLQVALAPWREQP